MKYACNISICNGSTSFEARLETLWSSIWYYTKTSATRSWSLFLLWNFHSPLHSLIFYFRDALIDMCRKNKVEQITLCIRNFKDMRLSTSLLSGFSLSVIIPGTFLQELAGSAPRLEIYERTTCEDNIFGLSREFWEKKEMNGELFSTKVVSRKQLRIDCAAYSYREHWLRFAIEATQSK